MKIIKPHSYYKLHETKVLQCFIIVNNNVHNNGNITLQCHKINNKFRCRGVFVTGPAKTGHVGT